MADGESDLETERLEFELETLFFTHCSDESLLNSKEYCSEFCKLVEEHTGRWQVPLPQMKVLRTAMICFTSATTAFPDDCQHIRYALSSLALSFFELMLFFSREEFQEDPLKDILDSFHDCHSRLLRHRNAYLAQVKQVVKVGGPWESPVLQGILRGAVAPQAEVEQYLSSEAPVFLELRVRYLQACERTQEAMALAKSCLEHRHTGRHLYFHQAYLTSLYKASLHEHLHKEMAEIDGRDAVEIICNTECVEKDELLLSLCRAFLSQQLRNGDMYYIWDLVFIWSRLHLRAHPSRLGFLGECRQLASSATNVRAIFPFIKVVTVELGNEGVQFCVELCARALRLCDPGSDLVTRSLVCKTIAFLLPHDLEVCRACALQVLCRERTLEAYRTVCLLYMQPDQEPHPHGSQLRTNVRFHILQTLKEGLCFDPEFWNLLTLRTHCLELISDNATKAAVLSEMKEEEEEEYEEYQEEPIPNSHTNDFCTLHPNNTWQSRSGPTPRLHGPVRTADRGAGETADASENAPMKRRKWTRRRRRQISASDEEPDLGDDPEIKYNVKSTPVDNGSKYSLRRNPPALEYSDYATPAKLPASRQREYLSRGVKNKILKRKGKKKRWLQGLPWLEQAQGGKEVKAKYMGKKRGRKPLQKLELSFPENVVPLEEEDDDDMEVGRQGHEENGLEPKRSERDQATRLENHAGVMVGSSQVESRMEADSKPSQGLPSELRPIATEADPELDGPALELLDCPASFFHNYSFVYKVLDGKELPESTAVKARNGDSKQERVQVKAQTSWRERMLRAQRYGHLTHHCSICKKAFKGLNVLRHALSHLNKKKRPRCILCGKRFKQQAFAKTHILQHIEEMCKNKPSGRKSDTPRVTPAKAEVSPKVEAVVVEQAPPAVNGTGEVSEDESQGRVEIQPPDVPPVPPPEQKPHKPRPKPLKPALSREVRIIRNLRTLIKKTAVLHKQHGMADFRDEQVHIQEDVVVVRGVPARGCGRAAGKGGGGGGGGGAPVTGEEGKETRDLASAGGEEAKETRGLASAGGEEGKETRGLASAGGEEGKERQGLPSAEGGGGEEGKDAQNLPSVGEGAGGEEGEEKRDVTEGEGEEVEGAAENGSVEDVVFYLCPSETCDRVFMRMSSTVLKHAFKCHIGEEHMIEKAFSLAKRKCPLCFRQMQYLQHYKDHVKLHDSSPRHPCYHLECSQRLVSQPELKNHMKTHQPFRPQCPYPDCRQVFSGLSALYDHEWRHYTQTPKRDSRDRQKSAETPWRMKSKDTWIPGGREPVEAPKPQHPRPSEPWEPPKEVDKVVQKNVPAEGTVVSDVGGQDPSKSDAAPEGVVASEPRDSNPSLIINGHEEGKRVQGETSSASHAVVVATDRKAAKKAPPPPPPEDSHLNVKEVEDISILVEGVQPHAGVPHITEHKTFKPEDPTYKPTVTALFTRPPPSTYLNESVLCMRKRRATDGPPADEKAKKYVSWTKRKKEAPAKEKAEAEPQAPQVTRQRCTKCLASFGSPEELKQHQALNTCSALFGFDSDDDS